MIKEYLSSLEKNYGYTGNWQPNSPVEVGSWTDIELGFLPWLKQLVGIRYKSLEIDKNLHSIISGSLGNLDLKKEKRAPVTLSHNVSIDINGTGQPVSIKAQKKGGFFAVFQDIYEQKADPTLFRCELDKLNRTSIAVVSGVTYVKKGILVVFNKNMASFSLSKGFSLDAWTDNPSLIDLDFNVSSNNEGLVVYQAESSRPLIPFIDIYIAERAKQKGFDGRFLQTESSYDITRFSYTDFFGQY